MITFLLGLGIGLVVGFVIGIAAMAIATANKNAQHMCDIPRTETRELVDL